MLRKLKFHSPSLILLVMVLTPGQGSPLPVDDSDFATITVSQRNVVLPSPTDRIIDRGRIDTNTLRGMYSLAIDVEPAEAAEEWALTIRPARFFFTPEHAGKSSSDLRWKLDSEPVGAWRPLTDRAEEVYVQPNGG